MISLFSSFYFLLDIIANCVFVLFLPLSRRNLHIFKFGLPFFCVLFVARTFFLSKHHKWRGNSVLPTRCCRSLLMKQ